MLLKDIEPFARQVIVTSLNKNTRGDVYTRLKAPDCRLFYILGGGGHMTVCGETYPLSAGCAITFQSDTEYTWQPDENGVSYIAVNFDYTMNFSHIRSSFHPIPSSSFSSERLLERIDFSDSVILNKPIYIQNATPLEVNLRLLASEFYLKNDYTAELLSSCLKFIIISVVRLSGTQENPKQKKSYDVVRRVIQYVENNYDSDLTNDDIGDYFHFNSSYLNRIFKQHTGETLHGFLVRYRMNLAMELLHTSNLSVNEIAEQVGFTDVPHFIRSFKKTTGKTPARYRDEAQTGE